MQSMPQGKDTAGIEQGQRDYDKAKNEKRLRYKRNSKGQVAPLAQVRGTQNLKSALSGHRAYRFAFINRNKKGKNTLLEALSSCYAVTVYVMLLLCNNQEKRHGKEQRGAAGGI
jgi:hypothetical protein